MADAFLLQGAVKWNYDQEMAEFTDTQKIIVSTASFTPPLHRHKGNIALSNSELIIAGIDDDEYLTMASIASGPASTQKSLGHSM